MKSEGDRSLNAEQQENIDFLVERFLEENNHEVKRELFKLIFEQLKRRVEQIAEADDPKSARRDVFRKVNEIYMNFSTGEVGRKLEHLFGLMKYYEELGSFYQHSKKYLPQMVEVINSLPVGEQIDEFKMRKIMEEMGELFPEVEEVEMSEKVEVEDETGKHEYYRALKYPRGKGKYLFVSFGSNDFGWTFPKHSLQDKEGNPRRLISPVLFTNRSFLDLSQQARRTREGKLVFENPEDSPKERLYRVMEEAKFEE